MHKIGNIYARFGNYYILCSPLNGHLGLINLHTGGRLGSFIESDNVQLDDSIFLEKYGDFYKRVKNFRHVGLNTFKWLAKGLKFGFKSSKDIYILVYCSMTHFTVINLRTGMKYDNPSLFNNNVTIQKLESYIGEKIYPVKYNLAILNSIN